MLIPHAKKRYLLLDTTWCEKASCSLVMNEGLCCLQHLFHLKARYFVTYARHGEHAQETL
jgi:hypothetical protein